MVDHMELNRRHALRASALATVAATTGGLAPAAADAGVAGGSPLLAPDFTIAARIPDASHYIHDPGMVVTPSGRAFVAAPIRRRREAEIPGSGPSPQSTSVLLARSDDRGASWQVLPPLPVFRDATPFVHQGALYLLIPHYADGKVLFMRSDDDGESWSQPTTIIRQRLWNCQTGWAVRDGRMYWAATNYPDGNALVAISADLSTDLLDARHWRISAPCELPPVPPVLKPAPAATALRNWERRWDRDTWLEPNVVNVNGRLRILLRVVVSNFATVGLGAVCDLEDDGGELRLAFSQFHPLPGGQCKFYILADGEPPLFWMLSNVPEDSQDLFQRRDVLIESGFVAGSGNDRRTLVLHYGVDGLNWFPAGVVARWASPLQAFMYPSAAIDGDDLAFISRTSRDAPNQHDADLVTFHRIRDFRRLAVDLRSAPG